MPSLPISSILLLAAIITPIISTPIPQNQPMAYITDTTATNTTLLATGPTIPTQTKSTNCNLGNAMCFDTSANLALNNLDKVHSYTQKMPNPGSYSYFPGQHVACISAMSDNDHTAPGHFCAYVVAGNNDTIAGSDIQDWMKELSGLGCSTCGAWFPEGKEGVAMVVNYVELEDEAQCRNGLCQPLSNEPVNSEG